MISEWSLLILKLKTQNHSFDLFTYINKGFYIYNYFKDYWARRLQLRSNNAIVMGATFGEEWNENNNTSHVDYKFNVCSQDILS